MNRDSGRGPSYVDNGESDYADFDNFSDQQTEVPSTKEDYTYILNSTGYTTAPPLSIRTSVPNRGNDILTEKRIKRLRTIIFALAVLAVLFLIIWIVFIALFAVGQNKSATNTFTQTACDTSANPSTAEVTSSPTPYPTTVCLTVCPVCPAHTTSPKTTFTDNSLTKSTVQPNRATTADAPAGGWLYDLIFLVDQSETSVGGGEYGAQNFQMIKNGLKSVANLSYMLIAPDVNRMAWIVFPVASQTFENQAQELSSSESNFDTLAAIDSLVYHPGGSNSAFAFGYTYSSLINADNGARKDPAKVRELVILISDGNYQYGDLKYDYPSSVAIEIRNSNTSIYAIAVAENGNSIDEPNLLAITGNPDLIYKIPNYTMLADTIKSIIQSQTFTPQTSTFCPADLIVVIDRSQSIGAIFNVLRKFLIYFTSNFPVDGDNQYRFAFVTYSDYAYVPFFLGKLTSNYAVATAINSDEITPFDFRRSGTNTAGALQMVLDKVLKPPVYKPINGSSTIVVLFTDGMHDVGDDPTIPAEQLRTGPTKATIVSVGIGPLVNSDELIAISGSKDFVYLFDDFVHLGAQFVDFVKNISCNPVDID